MDTSNSSFNYDQFIASVDGWLSQVRSASATDKDLAQVVTKLQDVRTLVGQIRRAAA